MTEPFSQKRLAKLLDEKIKNKKARLLTALKKHHGHISYACKECQIDRKTFYDYYHADEAFKEIVKEIEESNLDLVERKLIQNIKANDTTSIIFYLKCKGRVRGYVDKQHIEHSVERFEGLPDDQLDRRIKEEQNRIAPPS